VPTLFKLPEHLQCIPRHRKPPTVRQQPVCEIQSAVSVTDDQPQPVAEPTPSTSATSEHQYLLPSPRKLKRRLDDATDALEQSKKRLKISQQKSRRLAKKLNTMSDVIRDLKEKDMLSTEAAENISSSFSGPALDLVMRCLRKSSGQPVKSYPSELVVKFRVM